MNYWAKRFSSEYNISRKTFIKKCLCLGLGGFIFDKAVAHDRMFDNEEGYTKWHVAKHWESLAGSICQCRLCPNECRINPGETGDCHVRENHEGTLYSLVYSRPSVIKLDMIEKSPLYHYQLDEKVFSIATAGCNLSCLFCQNAKLSQNGPEQVKTFYLTPEQVIKRAKKHNIHSINFFYTEPAIYFEYMLDIARLAKKEGMNTFCVTAGYINPEPLSLLIPYIDAFVVGLKGFDNDFYNKYIGVDLEPIKKTLKMLAMKRDTTWIEIVNLLIPDHNDDRASIQAMCSWTRNELAHDIPLHFTRFEPAYKMKETSPTPISTVESSYKLARESGLHYVYIGNIPGHKGNNTYCPRCNKLLIERVDYTVIKNKLRNGKCTCGYKIAGHWI